MELVRLKHLIFCIIASVTLLNSYVYYYVFTHTLRDTTVIGEYRDVNNHLVRIVPYQDNTHVNVKMSDGNSFINSTTNVKRLDTVDVKLNLNITLNGLDKLIYRYIKVKQAKSLLTLFTTLRTINERAIIHDLTIRNWVNFKPIFNIVVFTDNLEVANVSKLHDISIRPIPKTAENGLPILKYMFLDVIKEFSSEFYGYANGDILFDEGLVKTLTSLQFILGDTTVNPVMITGMRWNVNNVTEEEVNLRSNLAYLVKNRGTPFMTKAEDYFITDKFYPWSDIPEVVVGSLAYDNWLIFNARNKNQTVINVSKTVLAVHQNSPSGVFDSHNRTSANYNMDLLDELFNGTPHYHKGFIDCIEEYTNTYNESVVLCSHKIPEFCYADKIFF